MNCRFNLLNWTGWKAVRRLALWLAVATCCFTALPAAESPATLTATTSDIDPKNTPLSNTPVDFFRHLLTLPPAQREAALSAKNEPQRSVLLKKVSEYESMPARERNHRLRLLEVRLHLLPLMNLKPEERDTAIKRIPENELQFVQARLKDWDAYLPSQQQQILGNPFRLHYFMYRNMGNLQGSTAQTNPIMPPPQTVEMEQAITAWKGLTDPQRTLWASHMKQFIAMNQANRRRVLDHLPPSSREQIQVVVKRLDVMSPIQRNLTVDGFNKFANLNIAQRHRFIRFAERWQSMSDTERTHWRQIAANIPTPPLPTP